MAASAHFAYVGSDSRSQAVDGTPAADPIGISVFSIDPATGALTQIQTLSSDIAFYFAFDADQTHLYVVNVIADYNGGTNGSAEAYARDPETGLLTFLNRVDSGGGVSAQPAVSPSGNWLLIANYAARMSPSFRSIQTAPLAKSRPKPSARAPDRTPPGRISRAPTPWSSIRQGTSSRLVTSAPTTSQRTH